MSTRESRAVVRGSSSSRRRRSKSGEPPNMSDLRIVLLGKSVSENSRVGNFILGRAAFDSEAPPDVVERVGGRLKDRQIIIINSPQLLETHLSLRQITQTMRECVYLSDPGPHVIVLLLKHEQCSTVDQECVEKVLDSFSERVYQHTMVLTTQEPTEANDILQKIIQKCCNRHFSLQGSSSPDDILQTFEDIVQINDGQYLVCADGSQYFSMKHQAKIQEEKLNLVVCGSDCTLKSSISELILQQKDRRSGLELHGRVISLVELPALFDTRLSEEEVMRQTLRCVSLCHPGVHVFLLIIPDAPLTDEDKAEMEEIQRIFSTRINKHMMILIMQNSEHQTEELNKETQSLIERFEGRHNFFGPSTQVSTLMENIEQILKENRGEFFSTETFLEAQMKKLLKFEEMKKKIHKLETHLQSQGSRENPDELRIVLLGKTGVGKSAAGNTILGRKAFTAETSQESVTKESQRETSDINGRHVTVIDTPGLFDTELTNEEFQREIRHCISMILPGPHVFIIVLNLGQRFTREEATSVKIIQETFGEKSLMFTMVLFTRGDDLKDKTIEQYLEEPRSPLMNLIEACGNRYHVFNNNQTRDRTQVSDLLEKIDNMVNANGESFYSCKMFREMEREKQEQQMKILMDRVRETEELLDKLEEEKERMKMMMEEEQQNHDEERKRRVEELKREIREQEKHQREIREEMRRERETFKHEIEEMRQEKENVKKEKENLQIRYDTEIHRLMNRIENERQNHDKERKRREEEFNARVEQYKTLMKEKEESEEKMHEEIKRERETFKHEIEETRQEKEKIKTEKDQLQMEIDRLMNRIETDRQNHETERKKREEFNEREEQYKREIKEKEESEEKMREEMKREREEWEKQKLEGKTRREEEDEKRREKEQRISDEFNERLKEERERMEREKEDLQSKHEAEENKFREREERYKKQIKEREEKESEMLEQMKLERLQWEKQTQDLTQKREEKKKEKQKSEHPVTDHTKMSDLRVVLLGKSVSENSRVENLILGTNAFDSEPPLVKRNLQPCSQRVGGRLKDRRVMVINSPQLLQTHISDHQITQTVRECVSLSDPGPHAFILVLQYNDFTEEDMRRVKQVLEKFSEEAIKHTIVLTTDEESYGTSSYFEHKSIYELIKECGGRHLQLDERNPEWRSEIFKSVDKILEENQEDYLTCEMFHDVKESSVDEEQSRPEEENEELYQENDGKPKERQKERSDEVSENVSGKQKLNLVLCGSDGSLTVSVSKLLQGKKLNPSHQKANSEECVKREERIHGRVVSLVELPAVNHLSEEEVMRQTLRCVSLCDPGVHVFLIIIPVGPLTDGDKAEIEKIQNIFDSREHFMVLFISDISVEAPVTEFVKHSPESQRLISLCGGQYRVIGLKESENSRQIPELLDYIEKMKTKPYSFQMYVKAQENRVRHETEEKYKEELKRLEDENKALQARIQSDGAEGQSDDQECLRIVLIGRTGSGKSATGNTILGRNEFHSQLRPDSVTTVCEKGVGEVLGRSVAVVDTPGLFDTTLQTDQVVEEIVKCVSLSSPGPHVFIIVLSLGRFTKEETDTVDLIKKVFGHKSAQFSIVLFTRGDDLENESIEDYVRKHPSAELKKLIRDCGNRFLVFNNREKQDKTQVIKLLNMIEEVKNTNQGRYFTNSMFEEAEMSIKKRMDEIMKEREREMENQREELQAKYEMDKKIMMKRLEEEKQRADEERKKMENQIREKEEKLRREFKENEKAELEKREIEDQKRSEEEKQRRAEYHQRIEEMKREIENQRLEYEKQQKEKEEEDRKREEKYRQDQEKMKNEQERIIAELQMKQEEETKKRESEEKRRKKEEEEEKQEWEKKIKEAVNDRKEEIKRQQREWEDEKKRQMREREEEERKRKEKHEEQLREKLEELEKMRKRFEREREEERQKIEEEREKQRRERQDKEREYEEKATEMQRHYEQLEQQRKEEWERRKLEDDERREEERKRWKKMIEHLKQEQEKENKRRDEEEEKRKEREEKERDEIKQKYEEEIKVIKKKQDEARRKAEELNDFRDRKEQHVQELKLMLEERQKQHELLEKLYKHLQLQTGEEIKVKKQKNSNCVIS